MSSVDVERARTHIADEESTRSMEHEDHVDVTLDDKAIVDGAEETTDDTASDGAEEATDDTAGDGAAEEVRNIELQRPDPLQDLLRRLSGSLRPGEEGVTRIPNLKDFFPSSADSPESSEVRLNVLKAIGQCKTLKVFDLGVDDFLSLSLPELEIVLIPMQDNHELEEIVIYSLEDVRQIGPHWHNFFQHIRCLTRLTLRSLGNVETRVSVELMAQVASGLRANVNLKLKKLVLDLGGPYDGTRVVLRVAEIISAASELNDLELHGEFRIHGYAKEALVAALKGCLSLKRFGIQDLEEGIADVLVEVYDRTCSHPILETLVLRAVDGLTGDRLALLMGSNIRQIYISDCELEYFNLEAWQSVGKRLLQRLALSIFI